MTTREAAPNGAPCWADVWTSDVEGTRRFYSELFGWEAQAPSPEFGGYFMFTRDGVPVAGAMGPMGDQAADDTWKIDLATDDMAKTAETARAGGAELELRAHGGGRPRGADRDGGPGRRGRRRMAGRDLPRVHRAERARGPQLVRVAHRGRPGRRWTSTARCSDGTPGSVGDSDKFRYTTMRDPRGEGRSGGDLDACACLPFLRAAWSSMGGRRRRRHGGQAEALGGLTLAGPRTPPTGGCPRGRSRRRQVQASQGLARARGRPAAGAGVGGRHGRRCPERDSNPHALSGKGF